MVNQIQTNGTNQNKKVIHFQENVQKRSFRVHSSPALKIIEKQAKFSTLFENVTINLRQTKTNYKDRAKISRSKRIGYGVSQKILYRS